MVQRINSKQIWNSERIVPGQIPKNIFRMHTARYIFARNYTQNALVLDVASGTGYGSEMLSGYAREVVGGDISIDSIKFGRDNGKHENLSFVGFDAHKLPFQDQMFDVVISFETIEHLMKPKKFVSECFRVLKEQGLFICSTYNRDILTAHWKKPLNPFHVEEFTGTEFTQILASKFDIVRLYGQLFMNPFRRFAHMFYYTLGFGLVRVKKFSLLQPLLGSIIDSMTLRQATVDFCPKLFCQSVDFPGYIIAVCKRVHRDSSSTE